LHYTKGKGDLPASSRDVSSDYARNISYSMTDEGESYLSLANISFLKEREDR